MSHLNFEPWHFYKIRCRVPKSKEDGGGYHEKWKFWFHLISGETQDGFFINSEKRWGNPLQMDIASDDINCHLPVDAPKHHKLIHASVVNFKQTNINGEDIFEVDEIFHAMPKPLACKIMSFLKVNEHHIPGNRMKIMESELKKYLK